MLKLALVKVPGCCVCKMAGVAKGILMAVLLGSYVGCQAAFQTFKNSTSKEESKRRLQDSPAASDAIPQRSAVLGKDCCRCKRGLREGGPAGRPFGRPAVPSFGRPAERPLAGRSNGRTAVRPFSRSAERPIGRSAVWPNGHFAVRTFCSSKDFL